MGSTKHKDRTPPHPGKRAVAARDRPREPLGRVVANIDELNRSFRRAFASALAEAGVNVQHAMHLTAHSDPRVHARYVMRTAAMRSIPDAAIPRLPSVARVEPPELDDSTSAEVSDAPGIVTARDVSLPVDEASAGAAQRNRATPRGIAGSDCWTRTSDPAVNSRLLYQLS